MSGRSVKSEKKNIARGEGGEGGEKKKYGNGGEDGHYSNLKTLLNDGREGNGGGEARKLLGRAGAKIVRKRLKIGY